MLFDRPLYYTVIHVTIGLIAAWYPPLLPLFLIYQLVQLLLNKRFFLFEGEVRDGNSLPHTALKIAEVLGGFVLGRFLRTKYGT
jgi:hypothetical protein